MAHAGAESPKLATKNPTTVTTAIRSRVTRVMSLTNLCLREWEARPERAKTLLKGYWSPPKRYKTREENILR